jgi:hypothetical protein
MSQSLIPIDALLCLLLVGRKAKKEKEKAMGLFSQGRPCLAGCAVQDFLQKRI